MMPEGNPDEFTRVFYGCRADQISEVAILTPMESTVEALSERADDTIEHKGFNRGFRGSFDGTEVTVLDSRIGSPVASDCVYYLRFTPCRTIIYTGLIGSLQPEIRIGDLIAPTAAVRGEGASKYFVDEPYPAVADFGLLRQLASVLEESFRGTDVDVYYGPIYTTDSFAAETPEFLELWGSRNIHGIEMETSAIYVIASLYGLKAASVHIVSDNPMVRQSFFDPVPDEAQRRKEQSSELLLDSLVQLVKKI
ncbi:MAG: hypothetical protein PVJ38_06465 [Candidatus Bathyarchaeota archaeon]|jgi:uridine phosphorylase